MKQKNLVVMLSAVIASLVFAPVASAAAFPFLNPGVTPPQDVIAANLDEITPQNTVVVVHAVPQTTASTTVEQFANPSTASFGLVSAIKDPNMSQNVPDCAPPPVPASNCNNIGQCGSPGNVSWSGWDHVSGGTCNGGSAGGWLVTTAGVAPANYYPPPPPPALAVGSSYTTPYGNVISNLGNGTCALNGAQVACTTNANGSLTLSGITNSGSNVTDTISSSGSGINYSGHNNTTGSSYSTNNGVLSNTGYNPISTGGTAGVTQEQIASTGAITQQAADNGVPIYGSGANTW